jgi:hypothetical protein
MVPLPIGDLTISTVELLLGVVEAKRTGFLTQDWSINDLTNCIG